MSEKSDTPTGGTDGRDLDTMTRHGDLSLQSTGIRQKEGEGEPAFIVDATLPEEPRRFVVAELDPAGQFLGWQIVNDMIRETPVRLEFHREPVDASRAAMLGPARIEIARQDTRFLLGESSGSVPTAHTVLRVVPVTG